MFSSNNFHIRPLKEEEAKSLHRLLTSNKAAFLRYLPVTLSQNKTVDASKNYIIQKRKEIDAKKIYTLGIVDAKSSQVAGLIILKNIDLANKQAEFAYGLGTAYQGQGWMTKAVKEVTRFAIENLGVEVLKIVTHKTNFGSCKVAEKAGFTWQKTLQNEHTPPGEAALDMELYTLEK